MLKYTAVIQESDRADSTTDVAIQFESRATQFESNDCHAQHAVVKGSGG